MDKGVRADYMERLFKAEEDEVKYRKNMLNRPAKQQFYNSKAAFYLKKEKTVLEEFQMVQDARPLKPPGRR